MPLELLTPQLIAKRTSLSGASQHEMRLSNARSTCNRPEPCANGSKLGT